MAGLIIWVILIVVLGTFGLVLLSEKCQVPWEKEISIGKRREIAYDDAMEDEIRDIINKINWDSIEPNKTYELALALGDIEDDFDWGEFV